MGITCYDQGTYYPSFVRLLPPHADGDLSSRDKMNKQYRACARRKINKAKIETRLEKRARACAVHCLALSSQEAPILTTTEEILASVQRRSRLPKKRKREEAFKEATFLPSGPTLPPPSS